MKRIQSLLPFVALFGIGVFALITRLYRLELPAEFVFDERYHVPAVRLMAENDPRAFEWWHGPIYGFDNHDWLPLAKYIQALFFQSFGHNAFAWRLPSAVFGVIGVALVFVVAQLAFRKISLSLLAALLLSLDGLWLVQSRVAMNDVENKVIPANEFRKMLGFQELKSAAFTVEMSGDNYIFQGEGFGHGVGLCQWGSRALGLQGRNYKQILSHYYPLAVIK